MFLQREAVQTIRRILDTRGNLSVQARAVRTGDDLFAKGLTNLAAVDVLLAVETAFGVTFPPAMVNRHTVSSIDALLESLTRLTAQPLAA